MNKLPVTEDEIFRFSIKPCILNVNDGEFVIEAKNYFDLTLKIFKFASTLNKKGNNKMKSQESYNLSDVYVLKEND